MPWEIPGAPHPKDYLQPAVELDDEPEVPIGEAWVDTDYTPVQRPPETCPDCGGPMILRHVCKDIDGVIATLAGMVSHLCVPSWSTSPWPRAAGGRIG